LAKNLWKFPKLPPECKEKGAKKGLEMHLFAGHLLDVPLEFLVGFVLTAAEKLN
jgi:hypothetical protein